ncbi:MAG: DUF2141 domain-containing protein [Myxococcota bacterium]
MQKTFCILVFTILLVPASTIASEDSGDIVLEIVGLENQDGTIRCGLYEEESWLKPPKAVRWVDAEYKNGKAYCTFYDIEPGEYGIGSFHDADDDHDMDTNLIGIPQEGVCASNDPKAKMGPPNYDDARFDHGTGDTKVRCTMRY